MTPDERFAVLYDAVVGYQGPYGYDLVDPYLVLAQSALETGYWTSNLIEAHNNAFGMRHPSVRDTTSLGATSSGFATYGSLAESVKDYFLRQGYFDVPNTANAGAYVTATLDEPYAYTGEDHYADAWGGVYEELTGEVAWNVGLDPVVITPEDSQGSFALVALLILAASARTANR